MARKPKKSSRPRKSKKREPAPGANVPLTTRALARRQVLKGVVAGSGVVASAMSLPKEWTKPVVQSIVATAQAQVSPLPPLPGTSTTSSTTTSTTNPPIFAPIPIPVPITPTLPHVPVPSAPPIFAPVPIVVP